ncbi:MAG: disulfide oxidoreductase [Firmicutes bacterium HGW-Firmicutes-8]|nr:MAG: disulfide oxidoreductase [Firmicutes bacterium HGW-Firmicutes-8]
MFRKEMSIMEALQVHPKARDIFKKHGMACLSCMGAMQETIQVGAEMHDIKTDVLIKELNALLVEN